MTSVLPGNDHNISLSDHFSYIVSDFNDFAETPAITAPCIGMSHEEAVVPPVLDLVELGYLYISVILHQTSSVAEPSVKVGMESAPSVSPVSEQIEFVPEPIMETSLTSVGSSVPASAVLVVTTSPDSPTLVVRPTPKAVTTSFTSLVVVTSSTSLVTTTLTTVKVPLPVVNHVVALTLGTSASSLTPSSTMLIETSPLMIKRRNLS